MRKYDYTFSGTSINILCGGDIARAKFFEKQSEQIFSCPEVYHKDVKFL